ncbi:MAG TPA: hypothetical protein VFA18_05615 [Gemmataceae bacterium]|nr:hypothetical protein [Gemmataceae bacterium]
MSTAPLDTLLGHIRRLVDAKGVDAKSDAQLLERFIQHKDDAAFAVSVRRHGPLVLGVCRRILGQAQDAEDAFQATAKEQRRYDFGGHTLWGLALSKDGKMLAGIAGSSVQLIDTVSGKTLGPSAGHRGEVRWAILTPDRKTVLTAAGGESAIHCWDVPSGREKRPLEGAGPFSAGLELAQDSRTLYSVAYPNGSISVWDLLTRKVLRRLPVPDPKSPPALLRLSPDDSLAGSCQWPRATPARRP